MASTSDAGASDQAPARFVLTLVTDRRRTPPGALSPLLRGAAAAGLDCIQVREKDLPDAGLVRIVADVLRAVEGTSARVFVNSRPDVAAALGAAGVQLPEEGLPVGAVKRSFEHLEIGASCHSLEAARRAEDDGADFILLGPIFATPGKEERLLGTSVLEAVAARVRIPVHAIGGIRPDNVRQVREAGARGAAAIRVFLEEPVDAIIRALRQ